MGRRSRGFARQPRYCGQCQLHAQSWTRWEIQHRCHPRSQIRHGATYTVRRHRVHWQWDVAAIHLPGSFLVVRLKKTEANVDTSVFCLEAHGSKQARYVPFFSAAHSVLPQLDRPHLPKSGPRFICFPNSVAKLVAFQERPALGGQYAYR